MKFYIKASVLFSFLLLICIRLWSQPSALVTNYKKSTYGAGSQNWSIDVDSKGFVYVANNNGLLVFDGARWKTYRTQGQTIVRSVYVSPDGRIYTGSFEEFGYWQKGKSGDLEYHSLKPLLKNFAFHNNEIWKIIPLGSRIYFQSFSSLFVYDQHTIKPIKIPGNIVFLLKAGHRLFIQAVAGALYEMVNDKLSEVPGSRILSGSEVKTILPFDGSNLLIGTTSNGVYLYDGKSFREWNTPANPVLKEYQINNGIISGGYFIFGTIVKGVLIVNKQGKILKHFDSENNLQNNTVLSLCSDQNQSIWIGLDKGIDNISFNNPITIFREKGEQPGAVYTAALMGNKLYVGTNRGVFTYTADSGNFRYNGLLPNSQGQVWQLKVIDGTLFCGHTNGTYIIDSQGFRKISDVSGGFALCPYTQNGKQYLIQSTYTTIVIYRKDGNQWIFDHQVQGFIEPARYLEPDHLGNIWVSQSVKGLFRIHLSNTLDSVSESKIYGQKDGFPSDYNIRVFKIANRVVFTTGYNLYTWDDLGQKIIPYTDLNKQLQGFEAASSIVDIGNDLYWFLTRKDIALFQIHANKASLLYRLLLPVYTISMVDQYENVIAIDSNQSLICLDDGFAVFNRNFLKSGIPDHSRLIWGECYSFDTEGNKTIFDMNPASLTVNYTENNLNFAFSVVNSPGTTKLFQYKLEGIDKDWSEWNEKSEVRYTRVPSGVYTFYVRTLTSTGELSKPLVLKVKVLAAWYASTPAMVAYSLVLIALFWFIIYKSRRRVERRHERILQEDRIRQQQENHRAEQEIMALQNQNLQAEISYKNIQLADATMASIKKNEVLIEIKNELTRQKEELGTRYPGRYYEKICLLIDRNISDEKDWQVFEALFDQAHENFFKRLKQSYPELTQSDLKLCAYLKLNLASKEIAPLLNISLRGVEIRRYRLRKRLSLSSDENLVKTIMQF